MRRFVMALAVIFLLLTACSSAPQRQTQQPDQQKPPSAAPAAASPEPVVRFDGRQVLLPEGIVGRIPEGAVAFGNAILLDGVEAGVANISFAECPAGAPESGCIGNHRAITEAGGTFVAGRAAKQFHAKFQKNSAAADNRTWVEQHTVLPLPSGRRVDIIGQVLSGTGKASAVYSAYTRLISSLGQGSSQPPPLPPAAELVHPELRFTLSSSGQKRAQVYLYAGDEKEWVEEVGSCAAKAGTKGVRGHYQFFLEPAGHGEAVWQPVEPYPAGDMTFNKPLGSMFEVLPGLPGNTPDLLILHQYATCGTTSFAVFALSPDGRELVHYHFQTKDGTLGRAGSGSVKRLANGDLQISGFDRLTQKKVSATWHPDEQKRLLVWGGGGD